MIRALIPLAVRLAVAALGALLVILLLAIAGIHVPAPLILPPALMVGALWWLVGRGVDVAPHPHHPRPDPAAAFEARHGRDRQVRRLEHLAHGAQPRRRFSSRQLAHVLAAIAEERSRVPDAPALSPELTRLLQAAHRAGPDADPVPPIDRRTLHRHLRELSSHPERDR